MKTNVKLGLVTCAAVLLAACSTTTVAIKQIKEEKLANGNVTKIGFQAPKADWECISIGKTARNWGMNEFRGTLKFGGGYQVLEEQAIEYANKNNLKPNYTFLNIPTVTRVNGINIHPGANAEAIYFTCKYPPAVSNRIF